MPTKTEQQLISQLHDDYVHAADEEFQEYLDRIKTESPNERVLLAAIISRFGPYSEFVLYFSENDPDPKFLFQDGMFYGQVSIGTQKENYRADFVLLMHKMGRPWYSAVIECDGHDFHEKTKEQAAKDKKRDRLFQKYGFHVLRFSGSEIWNTPEKCADEIFDAVLDAWHRFEFGEQAV